MVLTVVFAVPGLLWAESNDPQAAVQELLGEIRQIKKNLSGQEKADNQKHAHSALVWLNVAEISKKALGKHWAKCSDSEQKGFRLCSVSCSCMWRFPVPRNFLLNWI